MKSRKIFSILICLICYSCGNNTNDVKKDNISDSKISDTIQMKNRDIHDIDKSEQGEKIANERAIDPELLATWNKFIKIAANKDYSELRKICVDSVEGCHVKFSLDKFISKCLPQIFDTTLLKRFSEISYSNYLAHENQFQVLKEFTPDGGWVITFNFVKTLNGYRFYSCDSFGGPMCCH